MVVCLDQVDLAEDRGAALRGREILDVQHRVMVGDSGVVECTVVAARVPDSRCLLGHHMKQ